MTLELSLDDIKERHTNLYERAVKDRHGSQPSKALLTDVDNLLDQIRLYSNRVEFFDDYRWLSDAALQWQVIYSSKWNIAKFVELAAPPESMLQRLPVDKALYETELDSWRRGRAQYLGLLRQARQGRRSTDAEMAWDWRQAQVLFASEVLDGFPNFAGRIGPESYWRLEDVWLKEVKRIRAYFIWQSEGKKLFDSTVEKDHYRRACAHIREMLVDERIKAQANEFGPAKAFLETQYLTNGKILHDGSDEKSVRARVLISIKARRIAERRQKVERDYVHSKYNDDANWIRAESYVRLFYENIVPAVLNKDRTSTLRVLKAFQYSKEPDNCWWVINCFETALAIYFLDREIIKNLWKESANDPVPASYMDSSVPVSWSFQEFKVPPICRDCFKFDGMHILFRGVMTDEQREALISELRGESRRKDIELLYRRSRVIPKETTL